MENSDDYPSDLSSDDSELDEQSLENYINCVQQAPNDVDMIHELITVLQQYHFLELAKHCCTYGLSLNSCHEELLDFRKEYGIGTNTALVNLLKNVWFSEPKYCSDSSCDLKIMGKDKTFLDLQSLERQPKIIPTLPNAVIMLKPQKKQNSSTFEYNIFRTFHVEPFSIYQLNLFCAYTQNVTVFLNVTTTDNISRLKYQLPKSQIQYKFNSLNMNKIRIALRAHNEKSDQLGQIRLVHMSLVKQDKFQSMTMKPIIRELSPNLPLVATMLVSSNELKGLNLTVDSVLPYVDRMNVFINHNSNNLRLDRKVNFPDLRNPKIKVFRGIKMNPYSFLHWQNEFAGYHFFVSPKLIYNSDYFPLMLSKIQQYDHRCFVSLQGTQISQKNYTTLNQSSSNISPLVAISQDIKCHFLGLETMAYFTGCMPLTYHDHYSFEIYLSLLCQKRKIPLICVERLQPLIRINQANNVSSNFSSIITNEQDETLIKSTTWNLN